MIFNSPLVGSKRKHYKIYPDGDHIYEVVGLGKHSKSEELLVIYKPLFHGEGTRLGECQYACRPLSMWYDQLEYQGSMVSRFTLLE